MEPQYSGNFSSDQNGIVIASITGSKIHNYGREMRFLDRVRLEYTSILVFTDVRHALGRAY